MTDVEPSPTPEQQRAYDDWKAGRRWCHQCSPWPGLLDWLRRKLRRIGW